MKYKLYWIMALLAMQGCHIYSNGRKADDGKAILCMILGALCLAGAGNEHMGGAIIVIFGCALILYGCLP